MKLEGFWEGFGWEEVLYQCCRREKNKEKIHKEQNLLLPSLIIQILVHYRRYCIPYIYNIHIFTIFLPPNSHKYFCKQKLTSLQFFINAQCSIWMLDPLFPFSFEDPELFWRDPGLFWRPWTLTWLPSSAYLLCQRIFYPTFTLSLSKSSLPLPL